MLRIIIELLPHGNEEKATAIGAIGISNDGTGSNTSGNYNVVLMRRDFKGIWKQTKITNFPRKRLGPYDLLYRALKECLGGRNVD